MEHAGLLNYKPNVDFCDLETNLFLPTERTIMKVMGTVQAKLSNSTFAIVKTINSPCENTLIFLWY